MKPWFEGSGPVDITLAELKTNLADPAAYYLGVVNRMPGLNSADLVERGPGGITIETDEGLMNRSRIRKEEEPDRVVLECREVYQAGKALTITSFYSEEFRREGDIIVHRLVINGVRAPGFLGFFYRTFGGSAVGKAYMKAARKHLGNRDP